MKTLILTRSMEDNERTGKFILEQYVNGNAISDISQLKARFRDSLLKVPLIRILPEPFDPSTLRARAKEADVVLITGRLAAEVFLSLDLKQPVSLYVAGSGTADFISGSQSHFIVTARAGARVLSQALSADFSSQSRIFYLRGRDIAFDFEGFCTENGFIYDEAIVYNAAPLIDFPLFFVNFLRSGTPAVLPFFSNRSFEIFKMLIKKSSLEGRLNAIQPLCISTGMLESVSDLFDRDVFAAKTPDLQGMCALIAEHHERN